MSRQVVWTKRTESFFCDAANLTPFERDVLRCRISGMTQVQTSFYLSVSVSTIQKTVARIKRIYDVVQKEFPDELKPRRTCAAETYMDTH